MDQVYKTSIPYEIDPNETDVAVYYNWYAGTDPSWDDPGSGPELEIMRIVRDDGTEVDVGVEPYATWATPGGDLEEQIWQHLEAQPEPEPEQYLPGESKMRPVNDSAFFDLLTEDTVTEGVNLEFREPFRVGQIVRCMPGTPLFRFMCDYASPNTLMKIKESYLFENIGYDYIAIPMNGQGWIADQRLPVKHDDLLSEQHLRHGNLNAVIPGMTFRFAEAVEGMDKDTVYEVLKSDHEVIIESEAGDKYSISEEGAKNYAVVSEMPVPQAPAPEAPPAAPAAPEAPAAAPEYETYSVGGFSRDMRPIGQENLTYEEAVDYAEYMADYGNTMTIYGWPAGAEDATEAVEIDTIEGKSKMKIRRGRR
jgi:hypothetical protein